MVVIRFAMEIDGRIISGGAIIGVRVPRGFRDDTAGEMVVTIGE